MRINLYLTPSCPPAPPLALLGDPLSSSSSSSPVASTSRSSITAPKPLLALCPNGELVLIELQGSLEMEGLESDLSSPCAQGAVAGGQVAGEFSWGQGKEDKPTLLLSHHRLEGKLVTLGRPLAVLEKRRRRVVVDRVADEQQREEEEEETEERPTFLPSSPDLKMTSAPVNPLMEDSDEEDEGADGRRGARGRSRTCSPTMQRMKRDRPGAGPGSGLKGNGSLHTGQAVSSSSSSALPPLHKKPKFDSNGTPSRPTLGANGSGGAPPLSSIPTSTPQAPMRGSALDFSSPQPPSSPSSRAIRPGRGGPLQERAGWNAEEEEEEEEEEGEGAAGEGGGEKTPTFKAKPLSLAGEDEDEEGTPTRPPQKQRQKQSGAMSGTRKRQTSTYYDVVCIVRKKVLFSKRPEPVVHGLGAGAGGKK